MKVTCAFFILLAVLSSTNGQTLPSCFNDIDSGVTSLLSILVASLLGGATGVINPPNPCNLSNINVPFSLVPLGFANFFLTIILSGLKIIPLTSTFPIPITSLNSIDLFTLLCLILGIILGTLPVSVGPFVPVPFTPLLFACTSTYNALNCVVNYFNQMASLCSNPCIAAIEAQAVTALINYINGVPAGQCRSLLQPLLTTLNNIAVNCGTSTANCVTFTT